MSKFIIKETNTGYMFNLHASNGQVIATSQVYKSLTSCKEGVASVQTNAPVATIEDQTKEGQTTQTNPKFEIYLDKAGEYRFRLTAKNGQTIASSEGYKQWASCSNGIESVKKNATEATVEETATTTSSTTK